MLQQNRFSGIVLKNVSIKEDIPPEYHLIQDAVYMKSEFQDFFDGYKKNGIGAWSSCQVAANNLTLSRDRVGSRTVYYLDHTDYFCFANSIRDLANLPFVDLRPSHSGALRFFLSGRTEGMIEALNEVPPGGNLLFDFASKNFKLATADDFADKEWGRDPDSSIALIRRLTIETVEGVLKDCPDAAAFLSGGLDSSVIAASSRSTKGDLPFITALSGIKEYDEVAYAQDVVGHLGIKEWHQIVVANIGREIEDLHLAMELPSTSMGSFMQYEMMRFCKYKGLKNVLDGTGADALFGGHNYYHAIYWNQLIRKREFGKLKGETKNFRFSSSWLMYYLRNMFLYYYIPRFSPSSKMKFYKRSNTLHAALQDALIDENSDLLLEKPSHNLKSLNDFLSYEFLDGGVRELLRFTDRIGKHFGVASHPIFVMNSDLYQAGLGMPANLKINSGVTKYALRRAFENDLPGSVLNRKDKMGLLAPNNLWMKECKDLLLSYITEDLSDFFQVSLMRDLLSHAIDDSSEVENYKVFRFFSFAIWHKVFMR